MKIMCDTNVILDVFLQREPFVADSCQVLKLCEERKIEGYITASSVTDMFYLLRKYMRNVDLAYQALGRILEIMRICGVNDRDIMAAYQKKARDFEDCLIAVCAQSIPCDYIITRNQKDFTEFNIPLLTPSELLRLRI